uniref:Solute carrier family 25 member 16 n=1 Tax=Propithecus coquereli TaxID=379532 RepID=A0A2K6GVZ7_PROCO
AGLELLSSSDPPTLASQNARSTGVSQKLVFKSLLGGTAGHCAKTTVAPLDGVKFLLQAHNRVFSALRAVPPKEGYLGLYKEIGFMAFQHYKTLITTKLGVSGHVHRLTAGSMAGMTAVICTYPLDMVTVRLAFQVKWEHTYTGIIHAFKTTYAREGGFLGFYRGQMPTILGMAPYVGVSFFTFGTLKNNPNVLVLKTRINSLCGGVAGAIAQTISYPFDVTHRRMQLGTSLPEFEKCLTMQDTTKYVYGHHGMQKGLYRGLSLNYILCIASQAVAFTTYEIMKQFFHLN